MYNPDSGKPKSKTEDINPAQENVEAQKAPEGKEKNYREQGKANKEAVIGRCREIWKGIGNKLSKGREWLSDKMGSAVDHAFAAPAMAKDGAEYIGGKVAEGKEYVGSKAREIGDKAKEKFGELETRGRAAYEKLTSRVDAAKNKFNNFINLRKIEKLNQQEEKEAPKAEKAHEKARKLQDRLDEIRRRRQELLSAII